VDTVFGFYPNGTRERARELMEQNGGRGDVMYNGHGGPWCWYHWDYYGNSTESAQVQLFANGPWFPRVYGFACNNSFIERENVTIAEEFCFNPDGGALTYLGGTQETQYGGNYYYEIYLAQGLYQYDLYGNFGNLGLALQQAQLRLNQAGLDYPVFQYILLGDITTSIRHRPEPQPLAVEVENYFCEDQTEKTATITCNHLPVSDAVVTVLRAADSSFCAQQTSDELGRIWLLGDYQVGEYLLTASKTDFLTGTAHTHIGVAPPVELHPLQFTLQGDAVLSWTAVEQECFSGTVHYRVYVSANPYEQGELLADVPGLYYIHANVLQDYPRGAFYTVIAVSENEPPTR
jgi:hypothetical protein